MIKALVLAAIGGAIGYQLGGTLLGAGVGFVTGAFVDTMCCTGYLDINGSEGWDGDFD